MLHLSYQILFVLFVTGLVAGTLDAIAGGGGIISLPMLLGVGVPPHIALGTNKLQSAIGTLMATCKYYRAGLFNFKTVFKGLAFGFMGAVSGSICAQQISSEILKQIIPFLLLIIFCYTLLTPRMGKEDKKPILSEFYFYIIFGFGLGFYDGFFGPGTGSFWLFSLTFFLGYNLSKATAYTKVFNLKSNLIAVVCFAFGQNIDYRIGLCMAAGQLIGGQLGAHLTINKGVQIIRPIFIVMVSATILSLFYKNYDGSIRLTHFFAAIKTWEILALGGVLLVTSFYWQVKKRTP